MMERHEKLRQPKMVRLTEAQVAALEEIATRDHSSFSDAMRGLMREGAKRLGLLKKWDA